MSDLISIVIPVYNSEDSLFELYQSIKEVMEFNQIKFELILVDDNSLDYSYQKILALNKKDKQVKGIRLSKNFGQQNAIFCGLQFAKGQYIVTMDDDLQHQAQTILSLYQQIKKGYDVVYAIPKQRSDNFYRSLGSKLTNFLFNHISSKKKGIRVSSFRIINKKILEKIIICKKSFIYLSAIILKENPKIANIYTEQQPRKYGVSNYNFIKLLKLFLKLYLYYGKSPFLKYFYSKKEQFLIAESTFKKKEESK